MVDAALDKKAIEPVVLDVSELLQIVDYFVILSGSNRRQVESIIDAVEERLRLEGIRPLRREGRDEAEWVLLDYGDLVVHVFLEEVRRFYDLEHLWSDAPRQTFAPA